MPTWGTRVEDMTQDLYVHAYEAFDDIISIKSIAAIWLQFSAAQFNAFVPIRINILGTFTPVLQHSPEGHDISWHRRGGFSCFLSIPAFVPLTSMQRASSIVGDTIAPVFLAIIAATRCAYPLIAYHIASKRPHSAADVSLHLRLKNLYAYKMLRSHLG